MEHLEAICDWIILLAATGTAIYKLIEFVSKPTSKIKQKKNTPHLSGEAYLVYLTLIIDSSQAAGAS